MSHRLPVADIQFISDFAAFCRTKGDEGYDYSNAHNCALSQFLRASGRAIEPSCSTRGWHDEACPGVGRHPIPDGIDNSGIWGDGRTVLRAKAGPSTFSALADRLEALIADVPEVERV